MTPESPRTTSRTCSRAGSRTITLAPPPQPLPTRALDALRAVVRGPLVTPDEPRFAAATRVWNGARQSRPAGLLTCASAEDVSAAVRVAREHDLPLAVRGGGYSPLGSSGRDDALVLDMSRLRGVRVDRAALSAHVGPGATWGDVDRMTQRVGLVVPGLPISGIGVAGSTIGGGYGHLRRAYGLACDSLMSAELVAADGERLVATGDRNPELLWGLRGGGGNFGVLTAMTFRLRPLPEPVLCGAILYRGEHAAQVLRFYRDYTARLREDVSTRLTLVGADHSTVVADAVDGRHRDPLVAISLACVGPPDEAGVLVEPLRGAAPVLADLLAVRPYVELQAGANDAYPPGVPAAVGSHFVGGLGDDLIAALCESFEAMPPGSCDIHVDHMGGKVGRVAQMSTATPNRGAPYLLTTMARWIGSDGAAHGRWHDETSVGLAKYAVGGPHVGMISADVPSEQVYGLERYLRLAALKRRYDPDNVFAANQNVTPLP